MHGVTKFSALAAAAVVFLMVALAWLGPAEDVVTPAASAALFDEELVQEIYSRVSPAVVVVRADRRSGDSFAAVAIGSGFLVDREGHIATNNHVVRGADRVLIEL